MSMNTLYKVTLGTIGALLVTIGIYVGTNMVGKNDGENNFNNIQNNNEISVNSSDVKVNENNNNNLNIYSEEKNTETISVLVKYIDIYSDCDHETSTSEQYYNSTMEEVKESAREHFPEYVLAEESGNILVFEKKHNGKCPNHFLVKLEENDLCIYRRNEDGEYIQYQKTEFAPELLRETLKEKLNTGIYVDGLSELFVLLEDIEM